MNTPWHAYKSFYLVINFIFYKTFKISGVQIESIQKKMYNLINSRQPIRKRELCERHNVQD